MARQPSLIELLNTAWPEREYEARAAYDLFVEHCHGVPPVRVPGMDTLYRLAIRLQNGRTIEEAAGREYFYRWNLALKSRTFGIPHTVGM